MNLYTLVINFRGGTYVHQVNAENVNAGLLKWARALESGVVKYLGPEVKEELITNIEKGEDQPVSLVGVKNVSFFCLRLKTGFLTMNIIITKS